MDYTKIIQDVLYTVITGIVPLLVALGVAYARVLIKKQIAKVNDEYTKKTLLEVTDIISNVVIDTTNNFTTKLKANGEWDNDKAEEALQLTLNKVKEQLTDETKKLISEKYNNLEDYLKSLITATYETQKSDKDKVVKYIGTSTQLL